MFYFLRKIKSYTIPFAWNDPTDEFVNRARHKGCLFDFGELELVERIIELIVTSTPHELLQNTFSTRIKGIA